MATNRLLHTEGAAMSGTSQVSTQLGMLQAEMDLPVFGLDLDPLKLGDPGMPSLCLLSASLTRTNTVQSSSKVQASGGKHAASTSSR